MKPNLSEPVLSAMCITWQSVDEPRKLFFGYFGPGQVQCNWLALDDAGEGLWADGLAAAQTDTRPQAFITPPITTKCGCNTQNTIHSYVNAISSKF